jgi:hypothetical protein
MDRIIEQVAPDMRPSLATASRAAFAIALARPYRFAQRFGQFDH